MDIDVTQSSGVAVVSPRGDLDMATVHDVRRALSSIFDRGQSRLLIDLNAVAYIDSSGMVTLIAAMKHARPAGSDVRLCCLQHDVHGIIVMTPDVQSMSLHPTP